MAGAYMQRLLIAALLLAGAGLAGCSQSPQGAPAQPVYGVPYDSQETSSCGVFGACVPTAPPYPLRGSYD